MSCNYRFEWIGAGKWRLTSKRGMVWEGELLFDVVDTSWWKTRDIVVLGAKITLGDNNPIPTNGLEKLNCCIKRAVVNGMRTLIDNAKYR